ncbi:melatonin receptor type 1C-like [Saccoglossus kowalevskii]|uniref:Melatonin receptor type 1C-like n=1 Tax=Saccoglossus kowalevskii TaxID=10224 RepID=A0ABM0MAA0_SACKO|nr:PREDICTED: melatonin receptor type 1C-like [Saccoglossus kowalevskii]
MEEIDSNYSLVHYNQSLVGIHGRTTSPNLIIKAISVALLIATIIVGTVGNSLVIASITMFKRLRSPFNVLIGGLCVSDFTTCTFMTSLTIIAYVTDGNLFGYHDNSPRGNWLCKLYGCVFLQSGGASIFCMTAIAINRYLTVCRKNNNALRLTVKNNVMVATACHLTAVVFSILPLFNFSNYKYSYNERICLIDRTGLGFYYLICLSIATGLLPLLVIGYCYAHLWFKVYQSRRQVHSIATSNQRMSSKEIAITKTVFSVFLSYIMFISPYQFVVTFVLSREPPFGLAVLFFANSAVNPIIYGVCNPQLREAYRKLLSRNLCVRDHRRQIVSSIVNADPSGSTYPTDVENRTFLPPPALPHVSI